jgi:hypothetical protein
MGMVTPTTALISWPRGVAPSCFAITLTPIRLAIEQSHWTRLTSRSPPPRRSKWSAAYSAHGGWYSWRRMCVG